MEPIAKRLRNRIPPSTDPQDFRLLGPHVISAMKHIFLFDAACEVENETDAEWLERNVIRSMALMHRGISTMHSKFTMNKTDVPLLVEMGRYMMRLVDSLHLPRSYNLNYMCLGNPQLLQLNVERFAITEALVLGLQSLGCAQVCVDCGHTRENESARSEKRQSPAWHFHPILSHVTGQTRDFALLGSL